MPEKGAIEPDGVTAGNRLPDLISQPKRLVRRDWRVVFAGSDANAGREVLSEIRGQAEASAKRNLLSILVDIELRREERPANINGGPVLIALKLGKAPVLSLPAGRSRPHNDPQISTKQESAMPIRGKSLAQPSSLPRA